MGDTDLRMRLIPRRDGSVATLIGIDVGITLLSAEDLRTGSVWRWFMSNTEVERALDMIGLVPSSPAEWKQSAGEMAEAREGTSRLNSSKHLADAEPLPQIHVGAKHQIPASAFKFKIPIPAQGGEEGQSLAHSN